MSLNQIIHEHKPEVSGQKGKKKAPTKEEKELLEEKIELLKDEIIPKNPPAKKSPGRPRKNPPKTDTPTETKQVPTNASILANQLKCRSRIKHLKALTAAFPETLMPILQEAPIATFTYEELGYLIECCKVTIRDEVDIKTTPEVFTKALQTTENLALQIAASSDNDYIKELIFLHRFTEAAKADPAISTELKILGCEVQSYIPSNPFIRLSMNLFRLACDVYAVNRLNTVTGSPAIDPKFASL